MLLPAESSLFDSVGGLPLHPLVVHFAVVLLPLAALALVLEALVPALRRRYAGVTVLALAGGTAAAFLAKESGEALARQEGLPAQHALVGNVLPLLALVLLGAAVVWYGVQRRAGATRAERTSATLVTGLVAAVLALAVTGLSVVVGHTGATAVWKPDVSDAVPTAATSPTPVTSPTSAPSTAVAPVSPASSSPTPTPSASPSALTAAAVAKHATAASCWSIVNGTVYDLTPWIARHPGGQQRILGMCGKDATAQFLAQHGSSSRVAQLLAGFKLGPLAA